MKNPVILSGVAPSRREGATKSKDPYCTTALSGLGILAAPLKCDWEGTGVLRLRLAGRKRPSNSAQHDRVTGPRKVTLDFHDYRRANFFHRAIDDRLQFAGVLHFA